MNIVIADTTIRTDAQGRYCLNDLHRAAGAESRHQPANWLRMQQTQDLAAEIDRGGIPQIRGIESKQGLGTFVAKELVYAYAMWISPAFHLKVIRAYDAMVSAPPDPMVLLSDPVALRTALLSYSERVVALESKVGELAPKAQALDRLAKADGTTSITDAAKDLKMRPTDLFQWMHAHHWIYKRVGTKWIAYQDKLQQGVLTHIVNTVARADGSEKTVERVHVTSKGLTKLASIFGVALEDDPQAA